MTKLVLDLKPSQLVLSKDGSLKVGFFDRLCKVNVKRDDKGRELSFDEVAKLYIHIEIPSDPSTILERPVGERKVLDGEDVRWVSETELFSRAYDKYLALKNTVVYDPQAEIEELKQKLAAAEANKKETKAEDIAALENAPKKGKKASKEEIKSEA